MLLTLFLVQHHRPEERGVLPRAIRPRLQQAAPLRSAPGNGFETRGWLRLRLDQREKKKTGKTNWLLNVSPLHLHLLLLSITIFHRRNAAINTTRSRCPGWSGGITIAARSMLLLDSMRREYMCIKKHQNKEKPNKKQRRKCGVSVEESARTHAGRRAGTAESQTERLRSLLLAVNVLPFSLSFAPKQQLYSNKSNCKSDNC